MSKEFELKSYFDPVSSGIERLPIAAITVFDLLISLDEIIRRMLPGVHPTRREGSFIANESVFIHESAVVEPGVCILGPAYIGPEVVLRSGAYVRENVVMLRGSLLGHSSEAKNSLFCESASAPHFNYVGDSILGTRVNLGAGTILSNLPINSTKDPLTGRRRTIVLKSPNGEQVDTNLAKLGAILGDGVQTGCNTVTSPGTLIGPRTWVYPGAQVSKGVYPARSILKARSDLEIVAQWQSGSNGLENR